MAVWKGLDRSANPAHSATVFARAGADSYKSGSISCASSLAPNAVFLRQNAAVEMSFSVTGWTSTPDELFPFFSFFSPCSREPQSPKSNRFCLGVPTKDVIT